MTCSHVLGLIDAGPLADCPPAQLDAAWQHARDCASCGPALQASKALTSGLRGMPQVSPPPELAATVLARIARLEDAVAPVGSRAEARRGSPAPALATVGAALVAAALAVPGVASLSSPASISIALLSPKVGGWTSGLLDIPAATIWTLVLTAGVVLYAAGLFAPIGKREDPAL